MARPNKERRVFAEENVAKWVRQEREQRGWTLEGFAQRMADVGCHIQPSAIYKIETSIPPRRVTVDELVAFSRVLGISMARLTRDPSDQPNLERLELQEALLEEFGDRLKAYREAIDAARRLALAELTDIADDLRVALSDDEVDEEKWLDRLRALMLPVEQEVFFDEVVGKRIVSGGN